MGACGPCSSIDPKGMIAAAPCVIASRTSVQLISPSRIQSLLVRFAPGLPGTIHRGVHAVPQSCSSSSEAGCHKILAEAIDHLPAASDLCREGVPVMGAISMRCGPVLMVMIVVLGLPLAALPAAGPQPGGTLTYTLDGSPDRLDPNLSGLRPAQIVFFQIFDPLVVRDPSNAA